jgi:uncharacterized protein DUF2752
LPGRSVGITVIGVSQAAIAITASAPALSPPEGSTTLRRLAGGAVAAGAAALLGVAAWLDPSPTGLGTHAQLHLTPCSWIVWMDLPCPTCGMTTAFAHAADGNLVAAFIAQPMGCALAMAVAIALLVGLQVAATGSRVADLFARLWGPACAWSLGAGFVAAWVYKVIAWKGWLG